MNRTWQRCNLAEPFGNVAKLPYRKIRLEFSASLTGGHDDDDDDKDAHGKVSSIETQGYYFDRKVSMVHSLHTLVRASNRPF